MMEEEDTAAGNQLHPHDCEGAIQATHLNVRLVMPHDLLR